MHLNNWAVANHPICYTGDSNEILVPLVQTVLGRAEVKWQLGMNSDRVNDSEAGGLTNVGRFKQLHERLAAEM